MHDSSSGQLEVRGEQPPKPLGAISFTGTTAEPKMPQSFRLLAEVRERPAIAAYAIVGVMTAHHRAQLTVLLRQRRMTVPFAPIPDRFEGRMELLSPGLTFHRIPPRSGSSPNSG